MKKLVFLFVVLIFPGSTVLSNNIALSNVALAGSDITFDLGWENSWRDAVNYDAAWVFIKFRQPNGEWMHATLSGSGYTLPAGAAVAIPADRKGAFVFRSDIGSGNNVFNGFKLVWDHIADGVYNTANIQVKVIAIEMVFVPEGSFYLGDGSAFGRFIQQQSGKVVLISDQPTVVRGSSAYDDSQLRNSGILVDGDGGIDSDGTLSVDNAGYPTGYRAFYSMKYEISQGQYADFLNSITSVQSASRRPPSGTGGYPILGTYPALTAQAPEQAMSLLNWSDACAYADWSGLRPMTEMEFEKCARGPLFPVAGEFAWGSAAIHASTYTLQNAGMAGESISNPGQGVGNAMYSLTSAGISRPLRCGIFAASAVNVDRIETGASYYGIMELSGNAFERCVTLGNAVARNFDGSHGDGLLSTDGFADSPNWPGQSGGIVQTGAGSGHRGGAATYFRESCQVSSRYYAAYSDNYRNSAFGFRAVRSAD